MRKFRKISISLTLCLCFCLAGLQGFAASGGADTGPVAPGAGPSIEEMQKEVQKSMTEVISILSGLSIGMQESALKIQEQLDGSDGTKLVVSKKDMAELLQVRVFKSEELEKGVWRVTMAVKNTNDFPVRLVNLTRKQSVLLLDVDTFAYNPMAREGQRRTVTVPARASVKIPFEFSGLDAKPGTLRIFDTDFPVQ